MCKMALKLMMGIGGVQKDEAAAARLYQEAADLGDVSAKYKVGLCYEKGLGVAQDFVRAAQQYRQAADSGCASAMVKLGLLYATRRVDAADPFGRAAALFARAAERGDVAGHYNLGVCYATGRGVPPSVRDAVAAFTRAAMQGHPTALLSLAVLASRTRQPARTQTVAALIQCALNTGDARALIVFANMCLLRGQAAPAEAARATSPRAAAAARAEGAENMARAASLLERAAATGNACALCDCGVAHACGWGVPADMRAAAELWRRGAALDDPLALYNLALCYARGRGVPQDVRQAVALWRRGLGLHHVDAAAQLMDTLAASTDPADHALLADVTAAHDALIMHSLVFRPLIH